MSTAQRSIASKILFAIGAILLFALMATFYYFCAGALQYLIESKD
jgi:hypothetical protein